LAKSTPQLKDESISLQYVYNALGHAIRYDIITYLGVFHRPVQYSELVEWLSIKPGSFYFHMKKLKHLVEQDENKRFYLTSSGRFALNLLKSGENLRSNLGKSSLELNDTNEIPPKRFNIVLFGELIRRFPFNTQFKIFMLLVTVIQIVLLDLSKLGAIPFFFDGNLYFGPFICIIQLIMSMLIIWVLLELIMRIYSPIKGFSRDLLFGIPLAMLPLFFYPFLVIIAGNFEFPASLLSNEVFSISLMFMLQIVSAFFIIQLLQVIKSVNFERALVPVFIILYGFSILSFLLSSTGVL
jgi:hypothetical protein